MATLVEVVYPQQSSFSGTSQLNLGPYATSSTEVLIRAEVRGKINYQGISAGAGSVEVNEPLWALQWVPHTAAPADCVTTADGPNWLIRQQTGAQETRIGWSPDTDFVAYLASYPLVGDWGGQLVIGSPIDLWLSLKPPSGLAVPNYNVFASIRWWWSP